jgi:hypothetical protein
MVKTRGLNYSCIIVTNVLTSIYLSVPALMIVPPLAYIVFIATIVVFELLRLFGTETMTEIKLLASKQVSIRRVVEALFPVLLLY